MYQAINLFIFLILFLITYSTYFTEKKSFRVVKYNEGEYYLLSRNMYYVIFTVCTAPIFLGSLSLLKYGLWIVVLLFLLFSNRLRIQMDASMVTYLVFFCWLGVSMTYTSKPYDGFMMLVKYGLPLLFLYLGYSALNNEKDLVIFLKVVNAAACIYMIFIGGFGMRVFTWFYYTLGFQIFGMYASFANFTTAVFIIPVILFWLTKDKKYVYCALWMLASTVLLSVRTGLGGIMLSFAFAIFLRYKSRSIPGLLFAGAVFVGVLLYVPSVNEKFFGEDSEVTATDIVQGDALSMENMNTNGRNDTWEIILDRFYDGHEWLGSGLGVAIRFQKNKWLSGGGAGLIHNDYVQLLAETGRIGVGLLVLFYILVLIKVMNYVVIQRSGYMVRLTGIMALSSMAGIAFSMYFDNVVSMSMQGMVIPYIYLGFFLKAVDMEKMKREQEKLKRFQHAVQ